jgi:23S rRNA (guanosine2251-2'-O)-methyltransferase
MSKKRQNQKNKDFISIYGINGAIEIIQSKFTIIGIDFLENSNATKNDKLMKLVNSENYKIRKFGKDGFLKMYKSWRTQGIVIHLSGDFVKPLPNFENQKEPSCLLLVDGVEDPQNLGQIMRTSECAGIDGIILPKNRSGAISQSTLQVSQGAFIHLPLYQTGNVSQTIKSLKKQGYWIIGLENGVKAKNWYSESLTGKIVLIVGGEGSGIRQLTQKSCDFLLTIPMNGKINSLNVSASVSAILFERSRQLNY